MFASDGWYWDDPIRVETRQVLRAAARAAQIVDGGAGTTLEARLIDDLTLLVSPSRGFDGAEIYRMALADVGQPVGARACKRSFSNPYGRCCRQKAPAGENSAARAARLARSGLPAGRADGATPLDAR